MRTVVFGVLSSLLGVLSAGAMAAAAEFLPAGTPVQVAVDQPIDADLVKVGYPVAAHLVFPVKNQGRVVFPAGTAVQGKITRRKNNGIAGIPGYIEVGDFALKTPEGVSLPLIGTVFRQGESRVTGTLVAAYLMFFPILIKGQDGKVEAGAQSTLYTVEEYEYK